MKIGYHQIGYRPSIFKFRHKRFCPESDPDSSMGVWRGALLTAAGVPPDQIYAVDVSATPTVEAAAEAYERRLLQLLEKQVYFWYNCRL